MGSQYWRRVTSTSTITGWFLAGLWLGSSVSAVNASNCVENGGSMVCTAKDKFDTPWTYHMCDGSGSGGYTWAIRRQCYYWYDGQWVDGRCINATNRPMTDPDDASLLTRAINYDRDTNTCDITATIRWATDDEAAGYQWCWGSKTPTYYDGVEVSNMASLVVRDRHFDESGACAGSITTRGIAVQRNRSVEYTCPEGYEKRDVDANEWECVRPVDNSCDVGNPISPIDGCKSQLDVDYDGQANGLKLARHYRSIGYRYRPVAASSPRPSPLGDHWRTNFDRRLFPIDGSIHTMASIERPDGTVRHFRRDGTEVHNLRGGQERLARITDAGGETTGWRFLTADQSVEVFDPGGRLRTITPRGGPLLTLTYSTADTPPELAPFADLLITVTSHFGHALRFTYDAEGRMSTMTDPAGSVYRYVFSDRNLAQVVYPDDTPGDAGDNPRRVYHYEQPANPGLLTGITDENGERFATYIYDPGSGKAIATQHAQTDNAGPQEQYTLTYDSETQTTVTDAAGTVEVLTFQERNGIKRLVSRVNQHDGKGVNQTFDADNNLLSRTDAEGRVTRYTYTATNQRDAMTEAVGTPEARTTGYEYLSASVDLPRRVITPSVFAGAEKVVETAYDIKFNVKSVTENGFATDGSPVSRSSSFQHDAAGRLTRIDGPRIDVNDITTLTYYAAPSCTTGYECGQLQSVTNALGHVTTYETYDANGRVIRTTDPVGVSTRYTYDKRGRLLQMTQTPPAAQGADRKTTYTYYGVLDQLKTVTTPDGVTLTYVYDAAHDLKSITDSLGNTIEYRYDQRGNRTSEDTRDPDGALVRMVEKTFDLRNRVASINAAGSISRSIHDAVGNLIVETDPNLDPPTRHRYDALDRLDDTLDALGNITDYRYDAQHHLIRVQAPNNVTTTYEYDDLGHLRKEVSPDRGTTLYTHDAAGNVRTQTDARGVVVSYAYDALNRVTTIDYPGLSEDVAFTYDVVEPPHTCLNGTGRLCKIVDASGTTTYDYDAWGNVLRQKSEMLGEVYVTQYNYDAGNRITGITHPDGRVVTYDRDAVGRVSRIATTIDGVPTTVLTRATGAYRADGLVRSQTFGNDVVDTRRYDQRGRLTSQDLTIDPSIPTPTPEPTSTPKPGGAVCQAGPVTLNFGSTDVGTTVTAVTTVSHTGASGRCTVQGTGFDNPEFSRLSPSVPFNVWAGNSRDIVVAYGPVNAGSDANTLTITTRNPSGATLNIPVSLNGTGTGAGPTPTPSPTPGPTPTPGPSPTPAPTPTPTPSPTPSPEPTPSPTPGGEVCQVSPTTLNFGSTAVGTTVTAVTTVSHTGASGRCTVQGTGFDNAEFSRLSPSVPFNVWAGMNRDVVVQYAPSNVGADANTLSIAIRNPAGVTLNVTVSLLGSGQ